MMLGEVAEHHRRPKSDSNIAGLPIVSWHRIGYVDSENRTLLIGLYFSPNCLLLQRCRIRAKKRNITYKVRARKAVAHVSSRHNRQGPLHVSCENLIRWPPSSDHSDVMRQRCQQPIGVRSKRAMKRSRKPPTVTTLK